MKVSPLTGDVVSPPGPLAIHEARERARVAHATEILRARECFHVELAAARHALAESLLDASGQDVGELHRARVTAHRTTFDNHALARDVNLVRTPLPESRRDEQRGRPGEDGAEYDAMLVDPLVPRRAVLHEDDRGHEREDGPGQAATYRRHTHDARFAVSDRYVSTHNTKAKDPRATTCAFSRSCHVSGVAQRGRRHDEVGVQLLDLEVGERRRETRECPAHGAEPGVSGRVINDEGDVTHAQARVPALLHVGAGAAPVLNEKEGEVALGLGEVLGIHRAQLLTGLHADVEGVDQTDEERLAQLLVQRQRHLTRLGQLSYTATVSQSARARWLPHYLAIGAAWGCSFLFIKQSLTFLTPVGVAFGRWLLGALTLLAISRVRGVRLPARGVVWMHLGVVALTFNVGPGILFAFAESHSTSILAGLFNALTPLTSLFFITVAFRDEPVTRSQILGMLVGLAGVAVLLGVWRGLGSTSWVAVGALALAVTLYGVTFPYIRRHLTPLGLAPSSLASAQMLIATAVLAPAFVVGGFNGHSPRASSLIALGLLGVVGSGFAFMWNYQVIARVGGATASTVTYLTPIVAVVAGALVLHERLTWFEPVGGALVLLGAAIGQGRLRARLARARPRGRE